MLSNAYFLAKFGFDTAENEPCKVCRIPRTGPRRGLPARDAGGRKAPEAQAEAGRRRGWSRGRGAASPTLDRTNFTGLVLGCIEAKFCK